MTANLVTVTVIALIIGGLGLFAHRRMTKVLRSQRDREAANTALLLAEIETFKATQRTSPRPTTGPATVQHDPAPTTPPVAAPADPPRPPSVEEDLAAFFGASAPDAFPAAVPPVASPAAPHDRPVVAAAVPPGPALPAEPQPDPVTEAVDRIVADLRVTADRLQHLAAGPGTIHERFTAAHNALTTTLTTALAALPVSATVPGGDASVKDAAGTA